MSKRLFFSLSVLSVSLLVAGCSSGTEEASEAESTTASTSAGTDPACKTEELEARVERDESSQTDKILTIGLTNKSDDFCALQGFPEITLMNGDDVVPAANQNAKADALGISVRRGVSAYFDVQYPKAVAASDSCPPVNRLFIAPEGQQETLRLPLDASQTSPVCGPAMVTVSPIRPNAPRV